MMRFHFVFSFILLLFTTFNCQSFLAQASACACTKQIFLSHQIPGNNFGHGFIIKALKLAKNFNYQIDWKSLPWDSRKFLIEKLCAEPAIHLVELCNKHKRMLAPVRTGRCAPLRVLFISNRPYFYISRNCLAVMTGKAEFLKSFRFLVMIRSWLFSKAVKY